MSIFDMSDYGYDTDDRNNGYASLKDLRESDYNHRRREESDSYGESLISLFLDEDER